MTLYAGKTMKAKQVLECVGEVSQIAGMRRVELAEGVGKGVGVVEVRTGTGFDFDILLDRGMDIGRADYHGLGLVWRSPSGDAHPSRYDDKGIGWIRIFPGGLLTTCGLVQSGAPCRDGNQELGLHGRYTSLPASKVSLSERWEGEDYVMRVAGEIREAVLFGENLVLRREIETRLGKPGLVLRDTVTNEGFRSSPHMILYHCNFGYPLLDAATRLSTPHAKIEPRDSEAEKGIEEACQFGPPSNSYKEKVYYHHMKPDRSGHVTVELVNPKLLGGLTVSIRYRSDQLPYFTQWKNLGKGDYVCGLEPGNANVLGRVEERKAGRLTTLKPGESRSYEIEILVKGQ
jgi:hypothetical protein